MPEAEQKYKNELSLVMPCYAQAAYFWGLENLSGVSGL